MSSEETAPAAPETETETKPETTEEKQEANTTVHVGNLSWAVTEDQLKEAFEECGKVLEARIPRDDRDSSKGFGFVKFETVEECQKAVETMDGKEINDRAVKVQISDGTRRKGDRFNDRRGGDRYSDRRGGDRYGDRRGGDRRGGDRYSDRRGGDRRGDYRRHDDDY